jgi:hypothetical protein
VLLRTTKNSLELYRYVIAFQVCLVILFWISWGGYSIDAWRYLSGFDRNPFDSKKEYLFWITGHSLNTVVSDPWPVKIMSMIAVSIMCGGIISFFKGKALSLTVIGLYTLVLIPAFFLLFGNAIRQGLAAAIVLYGTVWLYKDKKWVFVLCTAISFFFHQTSLLIASAVLLGKLPPIVVRHTLLFAPLSGFVLFYVLDQWKVNLDLFIPYAHKHEGVFHYGKFFVAYAIAWVLVTIGTRDESRDNRMLFSYAYMVALSSLLLKYEVPFERLLLYSDLFLPFAVPLVLLSSKTVDKLKATVWIAGFPVGLALWSHPSITGTLGF